MKNLYPPNESIQKRERCLARVREMLDSDKDYLIKEAARLYDESGLSDAEDNFIPARALLRQALRNYTDQIWTTSECLKLEKKLKHI